MWNLQFESMIDKFPDSAWVNIVAFADDAALVTSSFDLDFALSKMQRAVDQCVAWGTAHQLHFAPKKCQAVLFTRKHKLFFGNRQYVLSKLPKVYIGTHPIP